MEVCLKLEVPGIFGYAKNLGNPEFEIPLMMLLHI